MPESASRTAENYVKLLWKMRESRSRATVTAVAEALDVAPATVTAQVKRLAERGWARHEPYGDIDLTPEGTRLALQVIRRHRLWELFLVKVLNFPLHLVDAEAEKMEHILSDELERRVDALLGHPSVDPHGHPIPGADGRIIRTRDRSLPEMDLDRPATVVRVGDEAPELLEYLTGLGLVPGATVTLLERKPFGGPLRVRVEGPAGAREEHLGREAAGFVAVELPRAASAKGERS